MKRRSRSFSKGCFSRRLRRKRNLPPSFPERFNMADYFVYHNLEEGRENKVCLYFEDATWTYGEVARLSNRTGTALRELGAGIEDRVLLVLPDCPEFVWTWFGASRIGAVVTMVNPLLKTRRTLTATRCAPRIAGAPRCANLARTWKTACCLCCQIVPSLCGRGLARAASAQSSRWLIRSCRLKITNTISLTRGRAWPSYTN